MFLSLYPPNCNFAECLLVNHQYFQNAFMVDSAPIPISSALECTLDCMSVTVSHTKWWGATSIRSSSIFHKTGKTCQRLKLFSSHSSIIITIYLSNLHFLEVCKLQWYEIDYTEVICGHWPESTSSSSIVIKRDYVKWKYMHVHIHLTFNNSAKSLAKKLKHGCIHLQVCHEGCYTLWNMKKCSLNERVFGCHLNDIIRGCSRVWEVFGCNSINILLHV